MPRECHDELAPFCVLFLRYLPLATVRDKILNFDLTHCACSNAALYLYLQQVGSRILLIL